MLRIFFGIVSAGGRRLSRALHLARRKVCGRGREGQCESAKVREWLGGGGCAPAGGESPHPLAWARTLSHKLRGRGCTPRILHDCGVWLADGAPLPGPPPQTARRRENGVLARRRRSREVEAPFREHQRAETGLIAVPAAGLPAHASPRAHRRLPSYAHSTSGTVEAVSGLERYVGVSASFASVPVPSFASTAADSSVTGAHSASTGVSLGGGASSATGTPSSCAGAAACCAGAAGGW
jgi:hypothetical protein